MTTLLEFNGILSANQEDFFPNQSKGWKADVLSGSCWWEPGGV